MDETQFCLAPPRPLLSRNPLMWLRFFGPGAVIASLTVGSGELLFPSRLGAVFGYKLLWIFPLVAVFKWVLCYCSARHMILTGAHPMERWNEVPGPRGWLPLFFFSIFIICAPIWASLQTGLLGSICANIFPRGDLYFWASVWVAVSFVLLLIGNYAFLERVQISILGLMLACIFIAVIYVGPDWLQVLHGSFVPQLPEYPPEILKKYPNFADRPVWIELTVAAAVIGGAAADYLGYASFLREKNWGRSNMTLARRDELQEIALDDKHPARVWVKAALIDTVLSMVMIVVIAVSFSILASVILQPQQLVPEKDEELLLHQSQFLTELSPVLEPLYYIAVFLAFFGNVYGGPEMSARICGDYFRSLPRVWSWLTEGRIHWLTIIWVLFGGVAIVWIKRPFPDVPLIAIVTFPAIYAGILMCGVFCIANIWADWRFLPPALRMNRALVALSLIAAAIFTFIAVKAMWKDTWWHFVILPVMLGVSMLVVRWIHRGESASA